MANISCAFAQHASRKQLRRFAASLGLQADEADSVASLLKMDFAKVQAALKDTFSKTAECNALEATIAEWVKHGQPASIHEHDDNAAHEQAAESPAPPHVPNAAPPKCCVECHKRTPFVFQLLDCRLCESCERAHSKYNLITLPLARSMHGVRESDLCDVQSIGGDGERRCFLRSDVERCARGAHGSHAREVAALRASSSREWKENSFSTDHNGKTQKWKEWNSCTYQKKQSMRKHDCGTSTVGGNGMDDCMDLTGLTYVD